MSAGAQSLGVGVSGIGWCASEHIKAYLKNPHTRITWLHGRDEARVRANLARYGLELPEARFTKKYKDLLSADDVQIVSITTPNDKHAEQAVAAAKHGKHIVLEKPTAMNTGELKDLRNAVRKAKVKTIVSFELHYNPYLRFVHWLRQSGRLESTTVCVVASQGLGFGEAGLYLDSGMLADCDLRVPWILVPREGVDVLRGSVVEPVASLADVAPTLLAIEGVPVPPQMQG